MLGRAPTLVQQPETPTSVQQQVLERALLLVHLKAQRSAQLELEKAAPENESVRRPRHRSMALLLEQEKVQP